MIWTGQVKIGRRDPTHQLTRSCLCISQDFFELLPGSSIEANGIIRYSIYSLRIDPVEDQQKIPLPSTVVERPDLANPFSLDKVPPPNFVIAEGIGIERPHADTRPFKGKKLFGKCSRNAGRPENVRVPERADSIRKHTNRPPVSVYSRRVIEIDVFDLIRSCVPNITGGTDSIPKPNRGLRARDTIISHFFLTLIWILLRRNIQLWVSVVYRMKKLVKKSADRATEPPTVR